MCENVISLHFGLFRDTPNALCMHIIYRESLFSAYTAYTDFLLLVDNQLVVRMLGLGDCGHIGLSVAGLLVG